MKHFRPLGFGSFLLGGALALLTLGGGATAAPFEVDSYRDLTYYKGDADDAVRHRLDLFVPRGRKDYPVVVLFHGGAWVIGDNRCFGLYSAVGEFLAGQGVGVALPNYRLSPAVKHPEHVRDAARAFRWVHDNIGKYGGSAERMFVGGHSAGSHLASLLATDERYLKAEGLGLADVRGVIACSGVYRIPEADLRMGEAMKLRLEGIAGLPDLDVDLKMPAAEAGRPTAVKTPAKETHVSLSPFRVVFGDDPAVIKAASPISHVRAGLPPFLILYAEDELPGLPQMAEDFGKALKDKGCEATVLKIKDRWHLTILFRATNREDAVARAVLDFVGKHDR
jgi:acetyl esterase/lipase